MTNPQDPAFPQTWHPEMHVAPSTAPAGLTKREYFAAMAMQGFLSSGGTGWVGGGTSAQKTAATELAEHAITAADALIEELSNGENK